MAAGLASHQEQLAQHGGGDCVRDGGLFESAMAPPQNVAAYGDPDAADLTASYAFGLARTHPFIDGNKRTALVVSELFLAKNGLILKATNAEAAVVFLDLASGALTEAELAGWFRERITGE